MELAQRSDDAVLKVANLIMDNLIDGANEIDHVKLTRDFTARMKRTVSKGYFEKVCSRYQNKWGYFAEREAVAVFRRPESIAIVWRQWCTKKAGQLVAELVIIETDSRYMVAHAMVY